jgi:hypothetical protein
MVFGSIFRPLVKLFPIHVLRVAFYGNDESAFLPRLS